MLLEHILVYWTVGLSLAKTWPTLQCVKNVLFNQLFVNTFLFLLFDFQSNSDAIYLSVPAAYLIEEVVFYWMHRAFHHPYFYTIHKTHHRWTRPEPFSAIDCHPLEHLLVNMFPVLLGPCIFGWPYAWVLCWTVLATISTLLGHRSDDQYEYQHHTLHHKQGNGNYGNALFTDRLFGTVIQK